MAVPVPTEEQRREGADAPNTAPFDISHHPAMAVPCGMSGGLPVSLMLVGKHFDEPTIYKAAFAFEQAVDWKKM
jgi:amidase